MEIDAWNNFLGEVLLRRTLVIYIASEQLLHFNLPMNFQAANDVYATLCFVLFFLFFFMFSLQVSQLPR